MEHHHYNPCLFEELRLIPDYDTAHVNFSILDSDTFGQA